MTFFNKVKSIRSLGGYRLRAVFTDGFIGEVDLAPLFEQQQGPLLQSLKDPSLFQKVAVEAGAATWTNGYDICPDVLRYYCEIGRVCSPQELAAASAATTSKSETADLTMHDKPKP